jgi:CBS domain-containing protein
MLAPLATAIARAPVSCGASTPVRQVLRRMHDERIGSMVVVDEREAPIGIFTTIDVLGKVAAPQASVDAPIGSVMTPQPVTLEESATLADAATAMARHGIRHVVVTRDGRLAGVVSERDLFALQRVSLRRTSERIHAARCVQDLQGAAEELRKLARHLLAQGVAAEQLTAMVSALNDSLTQRIIALASERHALPGRWCWLALGSEGRMEQTLVTDQDNALIFFTEEIQAEEARRQFLPFAEEVNRALAACGFPLCNGDVMARNPRWCLSSREWRGVFDDWIRNPGAEALLHASIFFDFRPLAGDARLAGELRHGVLEQTRANRAFLRAMTQNALRSEPPLGLIRDFAADALDLKALGARPFVDAARVLALAQGRPETGTAPRLRAVGEQAATDGFHFIQGLRLRHGNHVRTERLSVIDRRLLKEAFRLAALLQSRIRMDYHL